MSSDWQPEWDGGCPPLAVLEAFSLGKLPLDTFDSVAEHTKTCVHCEADLERLEGLTDSLIWSLGHHLADGSARAPEVQTRTSAGPTSPDSRLGQYELLEVLGEGGMGVVYKARQARPRRYVAVKIAHGRRSLHGELLDRLRTEIEAVGQLQHPNIIQIHESGEHDGRPYFAMEYAPAGNLAGMLKSAPLSERKAAELARTIAEAVEAVHRLGLIHRDLKPANVLIGEDGAPKLADFGLAKFLTAADVPLHQTVEGVVLGTPAYMAPEQARGDVGAVGPPADIYGLGAILFETLTGRPPFVGDTRDAILRQAIFRPAPPLSSVRRVSAELEAVCLKCLEKSPARRYATAQALADDLERWLSGVATVARPLRWWARHRRLIRRGVLIAAASSVLLAGLYSTLRAHPEVQSRMIERKLDRMQPVSLLSENGGTPYYRVRLGDADTKVNVAPDGTLTVHSWSLCLIELIRDPRHLTYRFQVDIRHENSDLDGKVGVYFGHKVVPAGGMPSSHFGQMTYNDIHTALDIASRAPAYALPFLKVPVGNRVRLEVESWGQHPDGRPWMSYTTMAAGPPFQVRGISGDQWRTAEITVSREGVQGHWDAHPVGALSAPRINTTIRNHVDQYIPRDTKDARPPEEDLNFDPGGGVGVLVLRGSASFRFATITPLPNDH